MKLYLVRHGKAIGENLSLTRPLTDEGLREVVDLGAGLRRKGVRVSCIWHSPKQRARETAFALAEALENPSLLEKGSLNPDDPVGPVVHEITEVSVTQPEGALMIVGHLPFLPQLAYALTEGRLSRDRLGFEPAAICCLELNPQGIWAFAWRASPGETL